MSSMCTLILVLAAVLVNNYGINDFMVQAIANQGITVTPTGYDDHGQVNRIKIEGAAGTAATKKIGDGTPYATIRVYKLQKPVDSDRSEYVVVKIFTANEKGGFSEDNIDVKEGDKVIITVEKGNIALDQEFVLSFSEPLDIEYQGGEVPISIHE